MNREQLCESTVALLSFDKGTLLYLLAKKEVGVLIMAALRFVQVCNGWVGTVDINT